MENMKENRSKKLALAALFAALSYVGFQFFRFDISVAGGKTAFHLGNTFVVVAALFLGGRLGGLAGAVGLSIADLTSGYAVSMPKTFLLKLLIGLIVGFMAHKIFKLDIEKDSKNIVIKSFVSALLGMSFNIIADPLLGYVYKRYILGMPQEISKILAKFTAMTTFVNAITTVILATLIYISLRPVLKKASILVN